MGVTDMTRNQVIEMARAFHDARCRAWHRFWMNGGVEPDDHDWGFHHGWFSMAGHNIGAHEYAPGPTYNVD
jgi:hypothetical protein